MLSQINLLFFLIIFFLCSISGQNVEIIISPNTAEIGKDLKVTCKVSEEGIDKSFGVFLKCPFNTQSDFCIKNCDSLDACTQYSCNIRAVGPQNFTCENSATPSSITYNYGFISLSEASMKNLKQLTFTCSFRGKTTFQQVKISKFIPLTSPPNHKTPKSSSTNDPIFSTKTNSSIDTDFKQRDIILISLISALLLSFLINIWCSVQWCVKKSKKNKNINRNRTPSELQQNFPMIDSNSNHHSNSMSSHNDPYDNIKRTRSQPTLPHDDRQTTIKSNNNFYFPNANSVNTGSRVKVNRPNTLTLDNYGSGNSLRNLMYPPLLYAPVQLESSIFQYCHPYSLMSHSIAPENKSMNNLDIVNEQECPEQTQFSEFELPPKRSYDFVSDKESVFS